MLQIPFSGLTFSYSRSVLKFRVISRTETSGRHGGSYYVCPPRKYTIPPQVLNPRSALLSNYEVLTLLRELDSDHLARTKTAIRIKKEEDSSGNVIGRGGYDPTTDDVSENLRTVEVEVSVSSHVQGRYCD